MSVEKKQARAVQDLTGEPYQKCLHWVRANREKLYRRTSQLIGDAEGLNGAAKKAAVQLARETAQWSSKEQP